MDLRNARMEVVETDPDSPGARTCLEAYYAELDRRFEHGFRVEDSRDPPPDDIRPPRGAFLVALADGQPVGCVALKRVDDTTAEVKRLWVADAVRGRGVARRLMDRLEALAAERGVRILRLDTNRVLTEARDMYRAWGWTEIDRFNDDPYAHHFFEKALPETVQGRPSS